jgi:hypothetical protein
LFGCFAGKGNCVASKSQERTGFSNPTQCTQPPPSAPGGSRPASAADITAELIGRINSLNRENLGELIHHAKLTLTPEMHWLPRTLDGAGGGIGWTADLIAYYPASRRDPAVAVYELTEIPYGNELPF